MADMDVKALIRAVRTQLREDAALKVMCYDEQEAAQLLGISRRTLQREREDGNIIAIQVRGQVRYPHSELEKYLQNRPRA